MRISYWSSDVCSSDLNLHPVEERIDVPMDMPFRAAIVTVDTIGRAAVPNVASRRDLLAAEAGEAPRLHCDVRAPHWLPKTHRNADARKRRAASAARQIGIVGVGPIGRKNLQTDNRKGQEARPAPVDRKSVV